MRIRVQSEIGLTQKSIYRPMRLCCHPLGDLGENSGVSLEGALKLRKAVKLPTVSVY